MRRDQFQHLISTYQKIITDAGIEPQIVDVTQHLAREEILGHYLWVLNEKVEPLLDRVGGVHEAVRLLGCIQGAVIACGLCTVAETRDHARAANMITWDKIIG